VDAVPKGVDVTMDILRDLDAQGYELAVKTKTVVHDHKVGAHAVTYADKLLVSSDNPGTGPVNEELRYAVRGCQPQLLAATCVRRPPIAWLEYLVDRTRASKIPVSLLAANVASFMGKHPVEDGPTLEAIIAEALRMGPRVKGDQR
jgi:hypothetical protein